MMSIMSHHPRHIVIGITAVILTLALAVGVALAIRTNASGTASSAVANNDAKNSAAFPLITFGSTVISKQEYTQALKTQRAAATNYFKQHYGVSLSSTGWTQEQNGEIPYQWLAKRTITVLRERHAAYLIGVETGLVNDDSYTNIVKRMQILNQHNQQAKAQGEVVYGRTSYDIASYLDYELAALKNNYTSDESNPDMALSDEDVQNYYDAHDWTIDGVEGKAPLDEVRGNVKAQMRSERYNNLVQSKAEAIDANVPWQGLYAYTLTQVE